MRFDAMLKPESIAVIGVSRKNDRHPANVIYNKLHLRYPVRAFPVNPQGGRILKEPIYPTISDVPEKVDLAVIAARAEFVPEILSQCIDAGVGGATVISGGFAESGRPDLQERIIAMAREADFPFIGPNCLGIYSPDRFDTFFLPGERIIRPEPGEVALVSQSGGVLVDQMVTFAAQGVGLSLAVSIGNKALVNEIDILEYLIHDPNTRVIAFYLEGFGPNQGRTFVQRAGTCAKPVVVLKAGKTGAGTRAVSSHTASLAGDYGIFSQIMEQFGIVEATNSFELSAFCESLSYYRKRIEGRVGIITVSGGHGALASDACAADGLTVPVFANETQSAIRQRLNESIRSIASTANPIDLTGSAEDDDFVEAVKVLSRCSDIDCILLLLLPYSPGISLDLGARLSQVSRQEDKPLVAYVPQESKYAMMVEGFELNRIPVASSIEAAVLMLNAMRRCGAC
jgi:acetate---CoA ligase (ADP-forming)